MNPNAKQATPDQINRWNHAFEQAVDKHGFERAAKVSDWVIKTHEADWERDWGPHYEKGIEMLWALALEGLPQPSAADEYEEIIAAQDLMGDLR